MNTSAPSLHLVILRDSPGIGLDYEPVREEIRRYTPCWEVSSHAWYVVSSDDDGLIKQNLSKLLPKITPESQMTLHSAKLIGVNIVRESKKVPDPLDERLAVVRVYHPANGEVSNPDMKALFERLTGLAGDTTESRGL